MLKFASLGVDFDLYDIFGQILKSDVARFFWTPRPALDLITPRV